MFGKMGNCGTLWPLVDVLLSLLLGLVSTVWSDTVDGEVKHGVLEELWVEREGRDGMDPSMSWLSASSSPCSWQSEQWWEPAALQSNDRNSN